MNTHGSNLLTRIKISTRAARILVCIWVVGMNQSFAQTSDKYNSVYANFYRAEELFQKMQYSAARQEFRVFINDFAAQRGTGNDPQYVKAQYYEGVAALELFNNDAIVLLETFNKNYPESIYKHDIYFRIGKYYYQKKDYEESLVWFNKLSAFDVEPENQDEFYFKLGYANFQEGNMDNARSAFHEIKDGVSQYAMPALYYYSHIAYTNKSYQTALDGFLKLKDDEQFGPIVPYYIAQIYYLQGNYEAVTEYAPYIDENQASVNKSDMNHLIGDAYYRIGKYDEAVPYLEEYDKFTKTTRDEDYQLGYAYFKSKQFDKAIKLLDRTTKVDDSLAQTAFYHIGESYLKLNNFSAARTAFQKASEMQHDPKIEEDALYQFAILSYKLDINPYNEALIAFERYLEQYPNSPRKNDVYQYLVNVYTSTNNYGKALESLDNLPNKDVKLKRAYQLIAYNYGVELHQKGEFAKSRDAFKLVDKFPIDPKLTANAKFWSGDAAFRMESYSAAIGEFKAFLNEPGNVDQKQKNEAYYNLGYAYLELGDSSSAIENLRIYTQSTSTNKAKLVDANLRIADCYYMAKNNDAAINFYKAGLNYNHSQQDLALFYLGKLYGIKGDYNNKIKTFSDLVNNYMNSPYLQQALFELGDTYLRLDQFSNALKYFNQLIKDYPNSAFVAEAKLGRADVYFRQAEYNKAEAEYKAILNQFGNDNIYCSAGARGLKAVYERTNQRDKIAQLAQQYQCANIEQYEVENVYFEPAYKDYQNKLYADAIPKFQQYLQQYPDGNYKVEARAYMADCYYELNSIEEAVNVYIDLLKFDNNTHTELAAIRVAKHLFNSDQFSESIPYYERLESISSDPNVVFNSRQGLMRANYLTQDYTAASAYADLVLQKTGLKNDDKLEANYIKGLSNAKNAKYADAMAALDYVTKNTTKSWASECKYTIGEIQFKQDKLTESDATLRALLKMKPSYDYWIAKALILQARISMAKDDLFQAEQTLMSVIDNYPVQDDGILTEANQLYDELLEMKNKPKSGIQDKVSPIIEIDNGKN